MAASMPWCYHGALTKQESEDMLSKKNKDGAYLIRDSETIQGAMCLCVYKKKVVYTYRILLTRSGSYTVQTAAGVEEKFFKALDDLIHHFKRKDQGLAIHLRHSIKRKTALLIRPPKIEAPPPTIQEPPPKIEESPDSPRRLVEEDVERLREQLVQFQHPIEDESGVYANVPDSDDYVEVLAP